MAVEELELENFKSVEIKGENTVLIVTNNGSTFEVTLESGTVIKFTNYKVKMHRGDMHFSLYDDEDYLSSLFISKPKVKKWKKKNIKECSDST